MYKNLLHKVGLVTISEAQSVINDYAQNRIEAAHESTTHEPNQEPLQPSWTSERNLERIQLIKEMRSLVDNFTPISMAIREMAKNVIPTAYRAATGDTALDARINDYLASAMLPEEFDYGQANDAFTCWELSVIDMLTDGDIIHRMVKPRGELSFYVQPIRGDLIGADQTTVDLGLDEQGMPRKLAAGHRRVGGIILDKRGRRVGFEKYHYNDNLKSYQFDTRIPGSQVAHILDPCHVDSIRGITPFKGAVLNILDLKDIFDYTKATLKFAASKPIIIRNESGKAAKARGGPRINLANAEDSVGCSSCRKNPCVCPPPVRTVENTSIWYLKLKERVENFTVEAPSANFQELATYLLSTGAWALNLPYSVLFSNGQLSGGTLRLDLSKAAASFKRFRQRVVLPRMVEPWKRAKILEGIRNGVFPGADESDLDYLCKGSWLWPADLTADEKYNSSTFIQLVEKGYVSPDDVCALKGTTHDEVMREKLAAERRIIAHAKELHKEHPELPLTFFIERLASGPANSAGLANQADKEEEDGPEDKPNGSPKKEEDEKE